MVLKNDYTQIMRLKFPEFYESKYWEETLEFWKGQEISLSEEMTVFGRFIKDSLNNPNSNINFNVVFSFIEYLLINGDQAVQDAAATCFLENLLNYDSAGSLKASTFIPFLGTESKEYCKAWDEFTGVKTPGLWEE